MKWIKCSERTPQLAIDVLAYSEENSIFMAWFDYVHSDTGDWYQVPTAHMLENVTHWMPLPKIPQDY